MDFDRDDARIGLLVLTCVGLFTALAFHRSMTRLVKVETPYHVSLQHAGDVAPGTAVFLQGVQVGQVKAVNLARRGVAYEITADLGLRPDIVLWQGTRALVASKTFGGATLELVLAPEDTRRTVLNPGSTLPGEVAPSLGGAVEEVQALARTLNEGISDLRTQLSQRGAGVLLDHPPVRQVLLDLDQTLRHAGALAQQGQGLATQAEPAMASLTRSLTSLEGTLAVVSRRQGDLDTALGSMAGTLKEMEGLATDLRAQLRTTGPEADATLKALQRNLLATEELIQLLKAKPSRLLYGTPGDKEREAARKAVREPNPIKPTK